MPLWLEETCKQIPLFLAAVIGWAKFFVERRDKRIAERNKNAADEKLRDIQRRGRAPDLRPFVLRVDKFDANTNQIVHPGGAVRPETPRMDIRLDLSNFGEVVRFASDDWVDEGLTSRDIQADRRGGAVSIRYLYDPAQRGDVRKITIHFETLDGLKLHQVYETKVGFCDFRRIDPSV